MRLLLARTNPYLKPRRGLLHIRHRRAPPCTITTTKGSKSKQPQRWWTAAAVAVALCLVFFAHGVTARPLLSGMAPTADTVMDVSAAAASPEGSAATWERGGEEALSAGKWLPLPALAGGLRFPGVFPLPAAGGGVASMPWIGGAPPAVTLPGGIPALVPPYVGATRQEQFSVWASLFNPFQVRAPSSTSVQGAEPSSRVPAVAGAGLERTMGVDEPAHGAQVGEPKWGVFLGTNYSKH